MVDPGNVSLPTLEIHPASDSEDQEGEIEGSSSGDAFVADTILVPNDPADETFESTNHTQKERKMESSRMEIIHNKRIQDGMTDEAAKFLKDAIRSQTSKAYDTNWNKFSRWCEGKIPKRDPLEYNISTLLLYLTDHSHLKYSTLNGYRSAIASVYSIIHQEHPPIAEHPDIKDFFRSLKNKQVNIPTKSQLETWDTNILVNYIRSSMSPSRSLSIYDLQQKLILLLCLHTMWRPRSDVGRIEYRDVR